MRKTRDPEVDKAAWGDGPWQEEHDTYEWVDENTGFYCRISRNGGGSLCGYVGLPETYPQYGVSYDDVHPWPDIHGGLTYASSELGRDAEKLWVFGFDCAHLNDLSPGTNAVLRNLGQDNPGLLGDGGEYRNFSFVKAEVESLAKQLFEPLSALAACGEE